MRIFEHNFVADKAKIRRHAAAWQGFLTQYAAKFAEKTCAYAYENRFTLCLCNVIRKRSAALPYYFVFVKYTEDKNL